jgi:hypothetical protein
MYDVRCGMYDVGREMCYVDLPSFWLWVRCIYDVKCGDVF